MNLGWDPGPRALLLPWHRGLAHTTGDSGHGRRPPQLQAHLAGGCSLRAAFGFPYGRAVSGAPFPALSPRQATAINSLRISRVLQSGPCSYSSPRLRRMNADLGGLVSAESNRNTWRKITNPGSFCVTNDDERADLILRVFVLLIVLVGPHRAGSMP